MYPSYPEQTQPFSGEESYKRLTSGSVLLAREVLHDPNFEATVVLICVHSEKGSYGLVLNRLAHMPLTELFDGFSGQNSAREVLIGGPVQQEEMQVIQITATPAEGAFPLAPTVYLGGRWQGIDEMVAADPTKTRLLLGYSGWDSGQLENGSKNRRLGCLFCRHCATSPELLGTLRSRHNSHCIIFNVNRHDIITTITLQHPSLLHPDASPLQKAYYYRRRCIFTYKR